MLCWWLWSPQRPVIGLLFSYVYKNWCLKRGRGHTETAGPHIVSSRSVSDESVWNKSTWTQKWCSTGFLLKNRLRLHFTASDWLEVFLVLRWSNCPYGSPRFPRRPPPAWWSPPGWSWWWWWIYGRNAGQRCLFWLYYLFLCLMRLKLMFFIIIKINKMSNIQKKR